MLTPTAEQSAIISAAQSGANLMVTAYAGTAKTTTLTMLSQSVDWSSALCLAFNVKIRDELKRRMPENWTIMTLNGLGHRAWSKAIGKQLVVDDRKLGKIITAVLKERRIEATADEWSSAKRLVSAAQQCGLVPEGFPHKTLVADTNDNWQELADALWLETTPQMIHLCREVLRRNIKSAFEGVVSFDDQVYMSAMFLGSFPRYDHVLVDEAQDLSPLNHIQVARCASKQIIAAGDPRQAIYAYRGADSNSMTNLRKLRTEWTDLPLTTTFRCPKIIVQRQQVHAPGFNAFDSNPMGEFQQLDGDQWNYEEHLAAQPAPLAILCRNNAPLLSIAFKLIKNRIGCVMLGRDIGKGLIGLSKKLMPNDDTNREACFRAIEKWQDDEISLAIANGKDEKINGIRDKAECLFAVLNSNGIATAGELRSTLESLFARSAGLVTLSTIHRAKGLEWPTVIHLDPWRLPSKFAVAAATFGRTAPLEQEKNLLYVCETRAKQMLILADQEKFQ